MFKVTWTNYGELDFRSTDFCRIVYDVSNHSIFYETCNDIKHNLRCDFGSIFDKIRSIVSSDEFQNENPYEDGCDGAWYKFEYTLNRKEVQYEGYIYGLKCHEEVISLIKSCAKSTLEDERKLLEHRCTDNEIQGIIESRKRLEYDFLDFWIDIETRLEDDDFFNLNGVKMRLEDDSSDCWKGILSEIQLPNGFIKCSKCNSIIHNKYFKNRKYWGRVWLSDDELGDYEVEYDSGECPVCGELNDELPYTGIECQPDEDLVECPPDPDGFDNNKLYSADELDVFLKHLSDEDRIKVNGCQFKVFGSYLYDDSGDMYYGIIAYRGNNEVGRINMYYRSNATPYYEYTMVLNEDSDDFFQPIVDKYLGECQPDDLDDSDSDRLYSADELDYLLRYLSDDDRVKVSDCQFKLVEQYPDDDSGDMYYDITVYRDNNEVGRIDMQYHSNTYWDLIDDELKTTNGTPYHSYTMTLNEDSKEDSKNPFDDTFGSSTNPFDNLFENIKSPFDNIKSPFDDTFGASKNHFDDSKFRCKKCGKIFCTCGGFFNRKG